MSDLANILINRLREKAFYGHAGRPGKVGGSAPKSGGHPINIYDKIFSKENPKFITDKTPFYGVDNEQAMYEDIVHQISKESNVDINLVNKVVSGWIGTSNDEYPPALHTQESFSKELGVELSDWQKQKIEKFCNGGLYDKRYASEEDTEKIARGMYDLTQKRLSELGYKPGDKITLYRGAVLEPSVSYKLGKSNYYGNAIESWSASKDIAYQFAGGKNGAVFSMEVPVENVVGTFFSGFGCAEEGEFVITGNVSGGQDAVVVKNFNY